MMSELTRSVHDNVLVSEHTPAIRIRLNAPFIYVGGLRFILYEVAQVEQHHFLVADENQRVQRLFWMQFEGYLEHTEYRYTYDIVDRVRLGQYEFMYDAGVSNIENSNQARPDSDGARAVAFLKSRGYLLEGDRMFERMVWLDASRRNELMFIYSEELSSVGYRVEDLQPGGSAAGEWPVLSSMLHQRATGCFTVL